MAAGYLLDTNLISETRKIRADAGVMAFLAAADAAGLFLSVLTLGELRKGVEAKRAPIRLQPLASVHGSTASKRLSPTGFCRWMRLPRGFRASCLPAALSR